MAMTKMSESQRRAIVRTAVTLGVIAFVIFVYTMWRGLA
jgi:hypothetical protein